MSPLESGRDPGQEADRLLADLDRSQQAAVTTSSTPLAILAGPGSGKTRVLTRRIAWHVATQRIDPRRVLAVTFTRKAAGELVERLTALDVAPRVVAGTFHALALALLRRWHEDHHRHVPQVLPRKARILAPLLGKGPEAAAAARGLAGEIEWAKARVIPAQEFESAAFASRRRTPRPPAEIAALYERYERTKRKRGLIDFEDLVLQAADLLERDPAFAAATRFRFRHLFVDEFQDLNPAQYRLLRAWLGDGDDLCVVGDPDQAVYGFAGADPAYLTSFTDRFPNASVMVLEHSYRCGPPILEAAGRVLDTGARPFSSAVPSSTPPRLTAHDDDEAEAEAVAEAVVAAHDAGRSWSELAVLYRTNAQSARFEESLARRGVPTRVRGTRPFLERDEVRADLEALRSGSGPLAERLGALGTPSSDGERAEHTAMLVALGREYLAADGGPGSVDGLVAWLAATLPVEQADPAAPQDAVDLLTFHRSKGLEWPVVFVTGLEEGLVPIAAAATPSDRAEERRLLYVACTRTSAELHVSWARRRAFGAHAATRRRSPLVDELLAGSEPAPCLSERGATPRERVARLRGILERDTDSETADPEIVAALRGWRRRRARAANVPAYVVCTDRTLHDLARRRPSTPRELLAVTGIGPVKVERFGPELLRLLREQGNPAGPERSGVTTSG